MQAAVSAAHPGMETIPSTYPVSDSAVLAGKVLGAVQMAAIALFLFSDRLLPALGIQLSPENARSLSENRVALCFCAWFFGNMLTNGLTSTGAFEIFYDGHKVRGTRGSWRSELRNPRSSGARFTQGPLRWAQHRGF